MRGCVQRDPPHSLPLMPTTTTALQVRADGHQREEASQGRVVGGPGSGL